MPFFTLQISPGEGPVVRAFVGVSQARAKALTDAGQPIPQPVAIRGLIDTGASSSCVDQTVVASLGITPTGTVSMCTPSTAKVPHVADQYDVALFVPGAHAGSPVLAVGTVAVAAMDLRTLQSIEALVGRDILSNCLREYNGQSGLFSLAY